MSKLLNYYFTHGFHVIRIAPEKKIPIANSDWTKEKLTLDHAKYWVNQKKGNLAVVCGEQSKDSIGNGLIVFDYDTRPKLTAEIIDKLRKLKTLICFTPKGMHIYFRTKDEVRAKQKVRIFLDGKQLIQDKVRWTNGYVLIPPSKVRNDSGLKTYWFLDDSNLPEIRTI
jgi:hypothetical protein